MLCKAIAILNSFSFYISSRVICTCYLCGIWPTLLLLIFRFIGLHSLRQYSTLSTSINNRLKPLYAYMTFIHTTASLNMNALCYVTPYFYYSALVGLYLSLFNSCA